jgi:hypothetical protein
MLPLRSLHEIRLPYHTREQRNFLADTLTDTTRTKRLYMPTYALEPTNLPAHNQPTHRLTINPPTDRNDTSPQQHPANHPARDPQPDLR